MPEWLKDMLTGTDLFEAAAQLWNSCTNITYSLLGVSPTGGQFNNIWNTISNLYDFFLIVGTSLMVLFFAIGFCRDNLNIRESLNMEQTVKMFFRLILTSAVITGGMPLMQSFFKSAVALVGLTQKMEMSVNVDSLTEAFSDLYLVGFLVALIFWLFCAACGIILITSVTSRFMKLYMIVPIAPVALSSFAGGGALNHTAAAWIKTFFAYTFEIVIIGIVLMISGAFISSSVFFETGEGFAGGCLALMDIVLKITVVVASVKGAEATLQKALGL